MASRGKGALLGRLDPCESPKRGDHWAFTQARLSIYARKIERLRMLDTLKRVLKRLQHPHHAQSAVPIRARRPALADAVDEVLALQAQGLGVGKARGEGLAGAGYVLAPRVRVLVKALVVDGQLVLCSHVVERGHAL